MSTATETAAASVGAADVFVLRRVAGQRFVHLGGSGRAEGWAGIVEVALDDEQPIADALQTGNLVRLEHGTRDLIFGPYYARAAAIVPVLPDIVVIFGVGEGSISADEDTLRAAAKAAAADVEPAGTAKRLADELEVLEAIRAAVSVAPASVEETMSSLADVAATALSCELGLIYLAEGDRLEVAERGWPLKFPHAEVGAALADTLGRNEFPFCVQDARAVPPPGPLATDLGIRSYYLLELTGVARGVLFIAHTDAAPRGFTLLCRRLGLRVAEATSAVLGVALTREWTAAESARLQSAFASLEG